VIALDSKYHHHLVDKAPWPGQFGLQQYVQIGDYLHLMYNITIYTIHTNCIGTPAFRRMELLSNSQIPIFGVANHFRLQTSNAENIFKKENVMPHLI